MYKGIKRFLSVLLAVSMFFSMSLTTEAYADDYEYYDDADEYTSSDVCSLNVTGYVNNSYAFEILDIVNAERAKEGLSPLTMDQELMNTATQRVFETAIYFSHTRPNGGDCFTIFPSYSGNYTVGENIADGYSSPEDVMNGWMNSPGHHANIMNSGFTAIGIGVVNCGGRYYYTQCFSNTVLAQATSGSFSDGSQTKSVEANMTSGYLSLNADRKELQVGESTSLYTRWNNVNVSIDNATYSSSNPSVVSVNNGKVTALSSGEAVVTMTLPGSSSITRSVNIKVHSHTYEWKITREPTCTEEGEKRLVCTGCGDIKNGSSETVPALGHSFDVGREIVAVRCTQDGTMKYTCTRCGYVKYETIKSTGHNFSDWTVTVKPTANRSGKKTRTCSVCGKKEYESIPKTASGDSSKNDESKSSQKGTSTGSSAKGANDTATGVTTATSTGTKNDTAGKASTTNDTKVSRQDTDSSSSYDYNDYYDDYDYDDDYDYYDDDSDGDDDDSWQWYEDNADDNEKLDTSSEKSDKTDKTTVTAAKKKSTKTKKLTLKSKKKVTLKKGKKTKISVVRTPATSKEKITYKSSKKSVATVNSKGVITAKKTGRAKITIQSGKKKVYVTVTVK